MSLLDCFPPGCVPREEQKRILRQIDEALESGYGTILLCAPTGIGKSHVAAAFALRHRTSYIVTAQKILQDQYSRDFGFLRSVKGKSNFPCPSLYGRAGLEYAGGPPRIGMSCADGVCAWRDRGAARKCRYKPATSDFFMHSSGGHEFVLPPRDSCPYYAQKYAAMLSPHSLHNYATYLHAAGGAAPAPERGCIVADEAHDIENQIVSFMSLHLTRDRLLAAGRTPDGFASEFGSDAEVAVGSLYLEYADAVRSADGRNAAVPGRAAVAESLRMLHFEAATRPGNVILQRTESGVLLRPVDVSHAARRAFRAPRRLFMSATLHPEMFADGIGLDSRDYVYIEVKASPFPAENRRVVFVGAARLGNRTPADEFRRAYTAAASILRRHRSEKGLVLCTSIQQCRDVLPYLHADDRRRMMPAHGGLDGSPSDIVRRHAETPDPTVLLSPSLWYGVDLKDDLSRFQIILKAPYPSMHDRRTALKARQNWRWYAYAALVRLLQGLGRSVRSPGDRAVTYVLDLAALQLVRDMRRYVPAAYAEVLYG